MKKNVLTIIRSGKSFKIISAFLAVNILTQCFFPTMAMALTSGPSQEEFSSFEPATTTDMVDLYSGDFNYNIPLLSVPGPNGGYPINLAYHSGVGMEQEASWVGLGWSLNVGAINRQLRGLPDDYNAKTVKQKMHLKPSVTVAVNIDTKKHKEQFGFAADEKSSSTAFSYQVYYNNYKGLGARIFANVTRETKNQVGSVGLGISYDSQEGLGLEPSMSLSAQKENSKNSASISVGLSYNSRAGIQDFSVSSSLSYSNAGRKKTITDKAGNPKEKDLAGLGYKGSSSISFSTSGTVPSVSIPMKTTSVPFDIKIGNEITKFGDFEYQSPLYWTGSVTTSEVDNEGEFNVPAYGYLHSDEAGNDDMKDFQRSPISYSKNIKNLAPSSFTYDLFSQTGQGTGSMFRPYASNVGILSSTKQVSIEKQHRTNLELGIGFVSPMNFFHLGAGYTRVTGSTTSGHWANDMDGVLPLSGSNGEDTYERYYFKKYGEKSGVLLANDELKEYWGGDEAVAVKVEKEKDNWVNDDFVATTKFVKNSTTTTSIEAGAGQHFRKQRQARSSNIEVLTDNEAALYGHPQAEFGYMSYLGNSAGIPNKNYNHGDCISEISILQPDGMRYTYGLPAYNATQTEATFSVEAVTNNPNKANVPVPIKDGEIDPYNSLSANTDEYLSKTTMDEPYAHSWMLTSVVSADYVDLTGNGPTSDDYGYWVKFNYTKTATNYRWRVPYTGANYFPGRLGDPSDDKGAYSYGEKEIYFLSSVETKTHFAIFELRGRKDGIQAGNELGTTSNPSSNDNPMKCLKSIKLYSRDVTTGRVYYALKSVFFEYSYSLCNGTPNSSDGGLFNQEKLTLDKVYMNYQSSERGALSPYKFKYGNIASPEHNPNYNLENMDRWGNYKNNSIYVSPSALYPYPYKDFPYTEQRSDRKPTAGEWSLRQIELPTGGTINVTYESDDYAYVENQRATHMFDIIGIKTPRDLAQAERVSTVALFEDTEKKTDDYYKVYFRLDENIASLSSAEKTEYIKNHVKGLGEMYFKIYAELTPARTDFTGKFIPAQFDYVTGWATVAGCDYVDNDVACVRMLPENLKKYSISGEQVNPFTKAAIQHLRLSRPDLVYMTSVEGGGAVAQIKNLLGTVGSAFKDIMSMIRGFNTWAFAQDFGQRIQLNGRSVIRLCDPNGQKYGGGQRVKELTINDSWDTNQHISNNTSGTHSYGQKYSYKIEENGQLISSGVAYEPNVGGDESALRKPIKYEEGLPLGTTSNLFLNKPLLEDYYPGASVGYRKVVVESIGPDQADLSDNNQKDGSLKIESSTAPLTVYEYYSPKDFPVLFDETDLNSEIAVIRPIMIPGIYSRFKKRLARSQGYSLILNDMAGKLRSVTMRTHPTASNKEGSFISKEEYIYNTENPYSETAVNKLSDKVQVVNVDPTDGYKSIFQTAVMGESHDVFLDMNENKQKTTARGVDGNLDLQYTTSFPIVFTPAFLPIPYFSDFEATLRTAVTMKIISRTGIVKKVITTTDESVISTENLAFDIETGKPLLTRTINEFEDPVYKLAYPAHWYYPNMAGAYKNYAYEISGSYSAGTEGQVSIGANQLKNFTTGDELWVNNSFKAHIYEINTTSNFIKLIKRTGGYVTGNISSLKVINSGRRNLLEAESGQVLMKELTNFSGNQPYGTFTYSKVVDASAVEFNGKWDLICNTCGVTPTTTPEDPFVTAAMGIWRPSVAYVYKTNRNYSADRSQQDGTFNDFVPFPWQDPGNKSAKWIAAQKMTRYSPSGFELENQDALNNYSSATYGYGQTVVTSVSKGSQFKEIAFDGFEDYFVGSCKDHQLDLKPQDASKITSQTSHTGFFSIQLKPGEKVQIKTDMSNCFRP
jgi:hypothetical protein